MTTTFHISGMTCAGCQAKVQWLLEKVKGVEEVAVDLDAGKATIRSAAELPVSVIRDALKDYPKYQVNAPESLPIRPVTEQTGWWLTYKPVLLIFFYVAVISLITAAAGPVFDWMKAMNTFMAGFFLTFSFFKLLDPKGFAESYAMYDLVAGIFRPWGYIYPVLEFFLGLAYITDFQPVLTNSVTLLVMIVSIAGVLRSVLNKQKIRCACLGAVFNLPMSTLTIIEDALMIVMSAVMLFTILHN